MNEQTASTRYVLRSVLITAFVVMIALATGQRKLRCREY